MLLDPVTMHIHSSDTNINTLTGKPHRHISIDQVIGVIISMGDHTNDNIYIFIE